MSAPPRRSGALRYCGRDFSPADLELISTLTTSLPTRAQIAGALCAALDWRRPDGAKGDERRVASLRVAADGLIILPPPRNTNGNGRVLRHRHGGPPAELIHTTLGALGALRVSVVSTPIESAHYNELITIHHYLGYTP